jgi:hypothetical protein
MANFNLLIEEYRIVTEKQKLRRNSRDDYGLGPQFYFSCGKHVDGVWTSVYVKPHPQIEGKIKQECCDSRIGSLRLNRNLNGNVRLEYLDILMISSGVIDTDVTNIPEDIQSLI